MTSRNVKPRHKKEVRDDRQKGKQEKRVEKREQKEQRRQGG